MGQKQPSPSNKLRMYVKSVLQYLRKCMNTRCEFVNKRHEDLAKKATQAILNRRRQCTTLEPTDVTSMIQMFQTDVLPEEERNKLIDAISSKTNFYVVVIEDTPRDEDGDQECHAFHLYLTDSDIFDLAVATSQHEAIQVLSLIHI